MRICFFGDSFVNGTGDDDCLGWTGRVCAAARHMRHDVTHYNLGIRRDSSADVAARWRREAATRLPPDQDGRLVFSFGANDCMPDGAGGIRVAHEHTLANARAILASSLAEWPTLMVGPAPVGDDASTDRRIKAVSVDLGQVCAALGVPYLDVFDALLASEAWAREAALGDGSHPNSGGYAALAGIVASWSAWRAWFGDTR